MSLLDLFRRPMAGPPEPAGPWASLDAVFYRGRALPPVAVIGTPHPAGNQVGKDGRVYAGVCIGTGPDAITNHRTHHRAYAVAMANAWMEAADDLDPVPAEMAGGAA